jgi:hypothetical protein
MAALAASPVACSWWPWLATLAVAKNQGSSGNRGFIKPIWLSFGKALIGVSMS